MFHISVGFLMSVVFLHLFVVFFLRSACSSSVFRAFPFPPGCPPCHFPRCGYISYCNSLLVYGMKVDFLLEIDFHEFGGSSGGGGVEGRWEPDTTAPRSVHVEGVD